MRQCLENKHVLNIVKYLVFLYMVLLIVRNLITSKVSWWQLRIQQLRVSHIYLHKYEACKVPACWKRCQDSIWDWRNLEFNLVLLWTKLSVAMEASVRVHTASSVEPAEVPQLSTKQTANTSSHQLQSGPSAAATLLSGHSFKVMTQNSIKFKSHYLSAHTSTNILYLRHICGWDRKWVDGMVLLFLLVCPSSDVL